MTHPEQLIQHNKDGDFFGAPLPCHDGWGPEQLIQHNKDGDPLADTAPHLRAVAPGTAHPAQQGLRPLGLHLRGDGRDAPGTAHPAQQGLRPPVGSLCRAHGLRPEQLIQHNKDGDRSTW